MGERDAFGRDKSEDSLADMGWKTSGSPGSQPAPRTPGEPSAFNAGEAASPFARPKAPEASPSGGAAAGSDAPPLGGAASRSAGPATSPLGGASEAASPTASSPPTAGAAATPPAPVFAAGEASAPFARPKPRVEAQRGAPARMPPPARPRRRGPGVARLVVFLAVVGVIIAGTSTAVRVGGDAVDGLRDRIDAIASPEPATPSPGPQESFLRAAGLRDAIAKLPPGKLVLVRIGTGSLDGQVIGDGARHVVHIEPGAKVVDVTAPIGVAQPGFKLTAAAPLRVIRTATRRAHRSVNDVDYLVGTEQGWVLFFKDGGPRYRATPSGRKVSKL